MRNKLTQTEKENLMIALLYNDKSYLVELSNPTNAFDFEDDIQNNSVYIKRVIEVLRGLYEPYGETEDLKQYLIDAINEEL